MAYRRRILIEPHPTLRKVAKKVSTLELRMPLTQQLIDDMFETMYAAPGIGLAAPQVGVSKRIFVADIGEHEVEEERKRYVFVNPVLSNFGPEETSAEGCLSIPGKIGDVKRASSCTISALDRHGKKVRLDAGGLLARCIQHEIDHLDGILIIDKAANVREAAPAPAEASEQAGTSAKEMSI